MDYQLVLTLIGILGVAVSVLGTVITFGVIIYYFNLRSKSEKENLFLKASEKFNQEGKKIILETSRRIKFDLEQKIKKDISKFSQTNSQARELILQEARNKASELSKNLGEEIQGVLKSTIETISQKIDQAEKNIEDYKKEKFKEVDQKIYKIIGDVAKKTIGKAIDISSHEQLVMEALEKAKKEKIF